MLIAIRDRLTAVALIVFGGNEALNSDYSTALAMIAIAVSDCVVRSIATRHGATAVARAAELSAASTLHSDDALVEALRRSGVPLEKVVQALRSPRPRG